MFEHHFGLRENPFVAGHHAKFVYPSPEHQEALAHLRFGIENREPFVLITGEVGTGKTTALYDALSEWQSRVVVALINNSALSRNELLEEIALRFGVPISGPLSKPQVLAQLERSLLGIHERGDRAILLLDEAQNLERDLLEEIRLLSNLEANGQKLLQVFLVGQPELEVKLARTELRQLRQRITVHYRLNPLSAEDTERYIHHRISVAGGHALSVFPPEACLAVHRLTHGIPREINNVCSQALLNAFVEDARSVAPSHVSGAAEETEFTSVMERDDSPAFAHRDDDAPRAVTVPVSPPVRATTPVEPGVDAYGPTPLDRLGSPDEAESEDGAETQDDFEMQDEGESLDDAELDDDESPLEIPEPEPEHATPLEIPAIDNWMSSQTQQRASRAAASEPPATVRPAPPVGFEATTSSDRPPSLPPHAQPERVKLSPGGAEIPRLPQAGDTPAPPAATPPIAAPPIPAPPIAAPPIAAPPIAARPVAPPEAAKPAAPRRVSVPRVTPPPAKAPPVATPAATRETVEPAPRLAPPPTPPRPVEARPAEPPAAPPRRSLAEEQRAALPPRLRAKLDEVSEDEEVVEHEGGGLPRPLIAVGAIVVIAIGVLMFVRFGPLTNRAKPPAPAVVEPSTSVRAIPQPAKISSASSGAPTVTASPTPQSSGPASPSAPVTTPSTVAAKPTAPSPTIKAGAAVPASQAAKPVAKVTAPPKPAPKVVAKPAAPRTTFGVAVATYLSEERAGAEREKLAASSGLSGRVLTVTEDGSEVYRVVLGSFADRLAAERGASDLIRKGLVDEARVISLGSAKP